MRNRRYPPSQSAKLGFHGRSSSPYRQLLDNYSGYYAAVLPKGVITCSAEATLGQDKLKNEQDKTIAANGVQTRTIIRPEGIAQQDRYLISHGKSTAQLTNRLTIVAETELLRHVEERPQATWFARHTQQYSFILGFDYRNFVWDGVSRRDIAWENVSKIDYLLGPLLREDDYLISLRVTPPTSQYTTQSESANLFNFFKGNFDQIWGASLLAARGAAENFQTEMGVQWSYNRTNYGTHYVRSVNWVSTPSLILQPVDYLRAGIRMSSRVQSPKVENRLWNTSSSRTLTSWDLTVGVTVVI